MRSIPFLFSIAAIALPLTATLVGCNTASPVGKWSGTVSQIPGATFDITKDNKVMLSANSPMGAVVANGTCTITGDKLTWELTEVLASGKNIISLLPANMKAQLNQNVTWSIKDGNLELKNDKGTTVLTPIKN